MSRTKDKQENSKEDGTSKTTSAIQGNDVLMAQSPSIQKLNIVIP